MKKILSLIIIMTILLSLGTQSFAIVNEVPSREISLRYVNLMTLGTAFTIDSLGIASCGGNMTQSLSDGSCKLIINLQKQTSSGWDTIKTWTKEGIMKCINVQYRAVSSGTYRLYVIGKVYDSSGDFVESSTVYSPTKTY